jgi:hypothetical protein
LLLEVKQLTLSLYVYGAGAAGELIWEEAMCEDAMEILQRARKRRRREENRAVVLFQE